MLGHFDLCRKLLRFEMHSQMFSVELLGGGGFPISAACSEPPTGSVTAAVRPIILLCTVYYLDLQASPKAKGTGAASEHWEPPEHVGTLLVFRMHCALPLVSKSLR